MVQPNSAVDLACGGRELKLFEDPSLDALVFTL